MQVFPKEIHAVTRGSAAIYAMYIMSRYKHKDGYSDPIMYYLACVMLGFDLFTFYKTINM